MNAILLFAVLAITNVDQQCREKFGHPGDLSVTAEAEQYFSGETSYIEAAATIGEFGLELPSDEPDVKAYRWQNGKLEMHFRGDLLFKYRIDDRSAEYPPHTDRLTPQITNRSERPSAFAANSLTNDADRQRESEEFYRSVMKVIETGSQVAQTDLEKRDLGVVKYHASKLGRAIAGRNWNEAERIRGSMQISLQRSNAV